MNKFLDEMRSKGFNLYFCYMPETRKMRIMVTKRLKDVTKDFESTILNDEFGLRMSIRQMADDLDKILEREKK